MTKVKNFLRRYGTTITPFLGLIFVLVVFGILSQGKMFSSRNVRMLINQMFPVITCCIGATFYWAWGILDLSVAGILGCSTIFTALLINAGHPILALLAGIGVAVGFCLCSSLIGVFLNIPMFLSSLCFMFITSGILTSATSKQMIIITGDYSAFNTTTVKVVFIVVLAVICSVLFNFTSLGKAARIMGGNETAAKFSGIRVNRIKVISFIIAGVCIGVAAFFTTMRVGKIDYTVGNGVQFDVITAMVFGGMPFGGGRHAKLANGIVGSMTYILLSNGLQLAGVPYNMIALINGVVFLIVVYLTFPKSKSKLLP